MQKHQYNYESDTSIEEYQTGSKLFKEQFQDNLDDKFDVTDMFDEELKHIQKMALIGKLSPVHKDTLIEWKQLFPERFDRFCNSMDTESRQKLMSFLDL